MKVRAFNIVNFKVDGGAMFGVVPRLLWSRFIKADEDNLIPLALRSLLIEVDNRVILIDNGIGNKQSKKFYSHLHLFEEAGLKECIADYGYRPDEISDVILTHLHFDHCGGGMEKKEDGSIVPTFPNAKYWVSKKQWDNALNPNLREADAYLPENILPMKSYSLVNFIEEEGFIYPGVELRLVHGHTPGQLLPILHHEKGKILFGADLFPTKAHIPVKYNMAYDLDVGQTMLEKEKFLTEFQGGESLIVFQHDTQYEAGMVRKTESGFEVSSTCSLEDWLTSP